MASIYGGMDVKTAKIFRSGNSQAVRVPKEFQLEGDEVPESERLCKRRTGRLPPDPAALSRSRVEEIEPRQHEPRYWYRVGSLQYISVEVLTP